MKLENFLDVIAYPVMRHPTNYDWKKFEKLPKQQREAYIHNIEMVYLTSLQHYLWLKNLPIARFFNL